MLQTCRSFNAHEPVFLLLIVGGVFVPPMRCRDLMDGFITILAERAKPLNLWLHQLLLSD